MGPKRWSEKLSLNKDVWTRIFKSLKNICNETKLKEFQFKLIHRTIVTKKELFRLGVKTDDECLYCGDKDSIEHSFIKMFTKMFIQNILDWFTQVNKCQISPTTKETLFGITASTLDTTLIWKFACRIRCIFWQSLKKFCKWGSEPPWVALNPMCRTFLNFAKSCIISCLSKFNSKKKFILAVFEI